MILQAQASLFIASNSHYKPFSSADHLPSADGVSESTDLKPSEIFYVTCLSFVGLIKPIPPLPPDHYFPVLFFYPEYTETEWSHFARSVSLGPVLEGLQCLVLFC